MSKNYLFQSERLGFRNWMESDLLQMWSINTDPEVMEFFPKTQTKQETLNFIRKMQKQFNEMGFCYFAVERLDHGTLIGFIGLSEQNFETDFTPFIDIGWRLNKESWGHGFATEGAKRCLEFAFNALNLREVYSTAPKINSKSEKVMKKIGMKKVQEFIHPLLLDHDRLKKCILYSIKKPIAIG